MFIAALLFPSLLLGSQKHHPKKPVAAHLKIVDMKKGKGVAAKVGDNVTVDYTGTLVNGTKFDSSIGKAPFSFRLGDHQVIQGWEKGVAGMKVGGFRKLTIPPSLGYGDRDMGEIPPNSTLIFTIKLLKIEH